MFSKFTLQNFKSFSDMQVLMFACPNQNKEGSGITYIVGSNNSGKTTVIEALSMRSERKIKSSERIEGRPPEFTLYNGENVEVRKCTLIRATSYTITENPVLADSETFEIVPSRRHWASGADGRLGSSGQTFRSSHSIDTNRQNSISVGDELKLIEADEEKYHAFVTLVKRVIPEFSGFAVGYEDHEFIEYITGNGYRHKTEMLGDGVVAVIRILLHLFVDNPNALIIDEPELSLHPSGQRKLMRVLGDYSKRRQIIIATHSPYLINWKFLENGAVVNRVVKESDLISKIYTLGATSQYSSLLHGNNWQQPYLLDEVAKEIFFSDDNLLFLEGQEDVGLLKNESLLNPVNIFGYGVRGCSNFEFALKLALDLGFKKVGCILDAGTKESMLYSELAVKFSSYKIIQWNKGDIRDKNAYTSASKTGYFLSTGVKKSVSELDDFDSKLSELNQYFTQ